MNAQDWQDEQGRQETYTAMESQLRCPNCGNDGANDRLRICEYVFRTWPIDEPPTGGVLRIESGSDEITWEAPDGKERLYCTRCDKESALPSGLTIEWL